MDAKPTKHMRTSRRISMVVGSLAILALAASPTLAHARVGAADTVRHVLLASELVGADDTEASDLENLLDVEDGNDQGDNVDEAAGSSTDQQQVDQTGDNQDGTDEVDNANQDGTDEVDNANNDGQSVDTETDSPDITSGDSGSGGGLDGSSDNGGGGD